MAAETTPLMATSESKPRQRWVVALAIATIAAVSLGLLWSPSATKSSQVRTASMTTTTSKAFPGGADEIIDLPGKPSTYTSRLFSGYLPIANGGQGFYFMFESQSETPDQDPVLVWLNGGPGASSIGGCFSENGPLQVNDDGETLRVNEFGWNKQANLVCIESPVGVGFSYNASGIYKSDDDAQAEDLYWMLQSFFDKFPHLRANEFVISGESAAGMYVPTTAIRIVKGNEEFKDDPSRQINLKRFAVGNGQNEFGALSTLTFAYYHGMLGTEDYMDAASKCPQLLMPGERLPTNRSAECQSKVDTLTIQLMTMPVNNYGMYKPCLVDPTPDNGDELLGPLSEPPRPILLSAIPCLDMSMLLKYFNRQAVRDAMHAKKEVPKWGDVLTTANVDIHQLLPNATEAEIDAIVQNKLLDYKSTRHGVVTPLWKYLLDHGIQGVIYHGDTDMLCDCIGGLWAVESLKLPRKQPRSLWSVPGDSQVAGFFEDFGDIKYVTVKGAGHMVPADKPREDLAMLDKFILSLEP